MRWDRGIRAGVVGATLAASAAAARAEDASSDSASGDEGDAVCLFGVDPAALQHATGPVRWRLGGYAAAAGTRYGHHHRREDGFACSDLRPTVGASWRDVSVRVEGDALGTDTPRHLYEAWAAWEPAPWARFSAGQFRVALGSEYATHEADLPLLGYGFTSHFDGRHDVGARVDGSLAEGAVWYQAASVTGHGFDLEGERRGSDQTSLRATCAPGRLLGAGADDVFGGLHLGAAAAVRGGDADPFVVSNPVQTRVVDLPDLDGRRGRGLHFEAGWSHGPFQLGVEHALSTVRDVRIPGGRTDVDELRATSWYFAWCLTGERLGWSDGRLVAEPRGPADACCFLPPGRWIVSGRFSTVEAGRDVFDVGIARRGPSAWETMSYTLALTWEPSPAVRVTAGMVKTVAEDALDAFGGTKRDTSLVLRAELRF